MAARRLIAVMLVLLFLSSLAAALAPVESDREAAPTTTEPLPGSAPERGKLLRETLDSSAKRTRTIKARTGDQLQLRVTARHPGTIELVGLGADEDVDPVAPALFDVLLGEPGRFPVRELESRRRIGLIRVSDPPALTEPAPGPAASRS